MSTMRNYQVLLIRDRGCLDAATVQIAIDEIAHEIGVDVRTVYTDTPQGKGAMMNHEITETPALIKIRFQQRFGEVLTGKKRRDTMRKWVLDDEGSS